LHDIEGFLKSVSSSCIVFDEIHQLPDPSRILKIAADVFPHIKVLATGSSTLAATKKFRDSLAGRKRVLHLLPILLSELKLFGITDLDQRLLRGGLPQCLTSSEHDLQFYAEWMDSFYARDVQELFRIEKRAGFLKLFELLLRQSGNMFGVTSLAKHAELSRPTVMNYVDALQTTHAITLLRPFSGGGRREIIAQPKVYGFDTGFVSYCQGWTELRAADRGPLWEHVVLETLQSFLDERKLFFWRDKQQREVDFVVQQARGQVDAIECKMSSEAFESKGLKAFREAYPRGRNFLVCPLSSPPFSRQIDGMEIFITDTSDLQALLQ
jgi:predicted AAA+ superfamily ATPase